MSRFRPWLLSRLPYLTNEPVTAHWPTRVLCNEEEGTYAKSGATKSYEGNVLHIDKEKKHVVQLHPGDKNKPGWTTTANKRGYFIPD